MANGFRLSLEALTAVIDDTDLSRVWLDVKDPGTVGQVVQIQKEMRATPQP